MVEEKHITVCKNINIYLHRLIEQLSTETIGQADVDILGSLDELSKAATKYVDSAKKELRFNGAKEIKGEFYKIKKTYSQKWDFDAREIKDELPESDFLRCVKVISRNLETFLTKARIEELRKDAGTQERFTFESL